MADRTEIMDAIEALAVHCRPPLMSVEDRARWVGDWCEDLRDYPIDAIRTACHRWRNGADRKFPMPGQLRPMIEATLRKGDVQAVIEANQPWRPLSDEEYRALSLSAKIRHHQILAHAARREAGPMWSGGMRSPIEAMPPKWHELQRRADGHSAEVKRLREYINQAEARA